MTNKITKFLLPAVLSVWLLGCSFSDNIEVNIPNNVKETDTFSIDLDTSEQGFEALLYIIGKGYQPIPLHGKKTTIKASDLGVGRHLLILRVNYAGRTRFFGRYLNVYSGNGNDNIIDVLPVEDVVVEEPPIKPEEPPKKDNVKYSYEIVKRYPHSVSSYTQGLEFVNGKLYESTGLYGESRLRVIDIASGNAKQETSLSSRYFGEGITYFNNKLFWLTWKGNTGFVFNKDLNYTGEYFRYNQSRQGWGLTHDDEQLIKSDGTDRLWFLDERGNEKSSVVVKDKSGNRVDYLNELEYVDQHVFANEYLTNNIHVIDPKTGEIKHTMDMSALETEVKQSQYLQRDEVLNGIAYNPSSDTLFVTGKNWNKMFEIKLKKTYY